MNESNIMTHGDKTLYLDIQKVLTKAGMFAPNLPSSDNELNVFVNGEAYVYYANSKKFKSGNIDKVFTKVGKTIKTTYPEARFEMFFDWDSNTGRPTTKIA